MRYQADGNCGNNNEAWPTCLVLDAPDTDGDITIIVRGIVKV